MRRGIVGVAFLALAVEAAAAQDGQAVYERYCLSCHGPLGDGNGYAARHLDPRPRNFTAGTFKWRSTASGQLPRDEDILRTITDGLYGTNMPSWQALSPGELQDVMAYVKTFSRRFAEEKAAAPIPIPPAPASTPQTVAAGAQVYERMGCAACHGRGGRGDGPSATGLRDDWGYPIAVYDLTSGRLKCGNAPADVYRVFMTGLNGTPMPSFVESLTPEEAWQLVHYILSLRSNPAGPARARP